MSLVSPEFFALLAITVALLAIAPAPARNGVLLAASAVFYFAGNSASAVVGVAIVAINYGFLRAILREPREAARDRLYLISICFNLLAFVTLKLAFEPAPGVEARLWSVGGFAIGYPLGLSFIILMLHAALSDAYSGKYVPRAGAGTFFLYGTFFPYVSAGPVERLSEMETQLDRPARPSVEDLRQGVTLIALGLVKKLVVAGRIQPYVDRVFSGEQSYSATTVAVAIALNAVYVYVDFSGYTDIARGAARCLGIELRINFDRPFSSRSVTEFWRRWHISFSTWLRDYLFMPLAFVFGRVGPAGPVAAMFLTFVICGFWHRAAWTFILFGLIHGAALAIELHFARQRKRRSPVTSVPRNLAAHAATLVFLGLTIVLFAVPTVGDALNTVTRLATSPILPGRRELMGYLGPVMFALMVLGMVAWQVFERWQPRLTARSTAPFLTAAALAILFLGKTGGGFIYVQF